MNNRTLKQRVVELAPWHLEVSLNDHLSVGSILNEVSEAERKQDTISFLEHARGAFRSQISELYPQGCSGLRFLDCACNCGGYSFWMKELGAAECFGFDAREHWIRQARFLQEERPWPSEGVRFEQCDLYSLHKFELAPFNITLFKGIFYHLPDPIQGLRIACDLTADIIIVSSATKAGLPDGGLFLHGESESHVMSGIHGFAWFPTGPAVLERLLCWLGFVETRVTMWQRGTDAPNGLGRVEIVAARRAGLLQGCRSI